MHIAPHDLSQPSLPSYVSMCYPRSRLVCYYAVRHRVLQMYRGFEELGSEGGESVPRMLACNSAMIARYVGERFGEHCECVIDGLRGLYAQAR